MSGRFRLRARVVAWAVWHTLSRRLRGKQARPPRRILIAHHLLLGDTIMLAPLLAKLRREYPAAELVMTCPQAYLPLFAGRPYGVIAVAFDPRDPGCLPALRAQRGFDLALLPADNRYSWLARALDSGRIVAFDDPRGKPGNWLVTDWRHWPQRPMAFGDIAAGMVDGAPPSPYAPGDWPPPACAPFDKPQGAYCVLHLGASSPHKLWAPQRWQAVMAWAAAHGLAVVLTTGRSEAKLLAEVDPQGEHRHYPGTLDLAQMWHLLAGARFVLCPDTGIAHLARVVGTPAVTLFGPGSPVISGPGEFWRDSRYIPVWEEDMPCRDQNTLFERPLPWVRHCWRGVAECGNPVCMHSLAAERVLTALEALLAGERDKEHSD